MPPTKKRKFASLPKGSKQICTVVVVTCPDKACQQCFRTERGLASHFDKSPACALSALSQVKVANATEAMTSNNTESSEDVG